MNNFISVFIVVLFTMYVISVFVELYRQRNVKVVLNTTNELKFVNEAFERSNGHEWDLVQYSERPHIPTSKTHNIELEISETNKHQIK